MRPYSTAKAVVWAFCSIASVGSLFAYIWLLSIGGPRYYNIGAMVVFALFSLFSFVFTPRDS